MFDNTSNPDVQTYLYDLNPSSPSNRPVVSSNGNIMDDPLLRSPRQVRLTVYPDGSVRASKDLNPRLRITGKHTFERPHYVKTGNTVRPVVGRQRMAGNLFQNGIGSEHWYSSFDEAIPFIDSITQDNRYIPHNLKLKSYSDQHTVVDRDLRDLESDDQLVLRSLNGRTMDEVLDTPTDPSVQRNFESRVKRRNTPFVSENVLTQDDIDFFSNKVNQGISDSPKRVDSIPPTRQEVYDRILSTVTPVINSKPAPAPRTKTGRLRATAQRVIRPFMDGPTLESVTF